MPLLSCIIIMNLGVYTKHFTDSVEEHVWKMNEFIWQMLNLCGSFNQSRHRISCIVCLYLSLCFWIVGFVKPYSALRLMALYIPDNLKVVKFVKMSKSHDFHKFDEIGLQPVGSLIFQNLHSIDEICIQLLNSTRDGPLLPGADSKLETLDTFTFT